MKEFIMEKLVFSLFPIGIIVVILLMNSFLSSEESKCIKKNEIQKEYMYLDSNFFGYLKENKDRIISFSINANKFNVHENIVIYLSDKKEIDTWNCGSLMPLEDRNLWARIKKEIELGNLIDIKIKKIKIREFNNYKNYIISEENVLEYEYKKE